MPSTVFTMVLSPAISYGEGGLLPVTFVAVGALPAMYTPALPCTPAVAVVVGSILELLTPALPCAVVMVVCGDWNITA